MSGPFTRGELKQIVGGPFRLSPIHVVEKVGAPGDPVKHRITINLSFKDADEFAVNDFIESDDFPTRWGGAPEVERIIAMAPPGTQAAALDIEAAFRTVPLLPDHKKFTVVKCDGFWLDHCCCFGCSSSGGNQGELADALVDILDNHGIHPVVKWVDDFSIFCYPSQEMSLEQELSVLPSYSYPYDLDDVRNATRDLNVPWHKTKGQDFAFRLRYVGFDFDIIQKTVTLPQEKRLKFKRRVDDFLGKASSIQVPLSEVWSLNGSLSHATFVYPRGRSYLPNISAWSASFTHRLHRQNAIAVLVDVQERLFPHIHEHQILEQTLLRLIKGLGILEVPLVVRLEGTNVELGKKILKESGLPIVSADNLADAAEKVVRAVKEAA